MVRKTGLHKRYYETDRKRKVAKNIELIPPHPVPLSFPPHPSPLLEGEGVNGKIISQLFNSDDKLFGVTDTIDFTLRIEEIHYLTKILSIIKQEEIGNDAKWNEYLQVKQTQENP